MVNGIEYLQKESHIYSSVLVTDRETVKEKVPAKIDCSLKLAQNYDFYKQGPRNREGGAGGLSPPRPPPEKKFKQKRRIQYLQTHYNCSAFSARLLVPHPQFKILFAIPDKTKAGLATTDKAGTRKLYMEEHE